MARKKTMEKITTITREKIVIVTLLSVCAILWIILQYLTSSLYIKSTRLSNIEKQTVEYKHENDPLKQRYLYLTSYNYIYQQAIKMGFQNAQIIYLK